MEFPAINQALTTSFSILIQFEDNLMAIFHDTQLFDAYTPIPISTQIKSFQQRKRLSTFSYNYPELTKTIEWVVESPFIETAQL